MVLLNTWWSHGFSHGEGGVHSTMLLTFEKFSSPPKPGQIEGTAKGGIEDGKKNKR